jgi:HK97 family phage prohead protease
MEDKSYQFYCEVKEVAADGTFEGIASVYGIEDLGGDVIDKGAFSKTLAENPIVPVLWQHQNDEVIGEGELSEWQNKVRIKGKLDLEDDTAKKAHRKIKRGLVKGLSIGFQTLKSTWAEVEGRMVRHVQELKLWEVSIVTFPMLPAAQVTRVKSAEEERLARLESQVSALQAAVVKDGISSTPQGAAKSGSEAAGMTQEPDEVHSAAASLISILRGNQQ